MVDLTQEKLIPLAQVADLPWVPRRRLKARLNVSTVYRWTKVGCRGVVLGSVQFAGTRCTTEAELRRFIAALGQESPPEPAHGEHADAAAVRVERGPTPNQGRCDG